MEKHSGLTLHIWERARAVSGQFRESFKLARSTGVKIAFGTDAGVFPHGENAKQFVLYVALGMSPMEALQSAPHNAADIGTIEAGKRADLIAVASNPLNDIRQLEGVLFVMKDGVVVKNETGQ
jgi:imidazolonepropionase-like amidohydrolase